MIQEPKLENDGAYQLAPGCPTFSVDGGSTQRAFPYHSFTHGTYFKFDSGHKIDLRFGDGLVVNIYGNNLHELWAHLQMQEVRVVRCNPDAKENEVRVTELNWSLADNEGEG